MLVVEDDAQLAKLLADGLLDDGWEVDLAGVGEGAFQTARVGRYDAMVFDEMLPDFDSATVCVRLRENGIRTRLLMLSMRNDVGDHVAALDAGADDYMAKPVVLEELIARLRALVRRGLP